MVYRKQKINWQGFKPFPAKTKIQKGLGYTYTLMRSQQYFVTHHLSAEALIPNLKGGGLSLN